MVGSLAAAPMNPWTSPDAKQTDLKSGIPAPLAENLCFLAQQRPDN
jgi:hypothetical protein